jgi:uracil-DNA glycosylase family 4
LGQKRRSTYHRALATPRRIKPRQIRSLEVLASNVVTCTRCPELRSYCDEVARTKRRAFADQAYWGRPVPSFGDPEARIMIVGLAPAAHGANRTGRMFTGDRSGDFLYAALHRAGLANQPTSVHAKDGLRLTDVYITAAAHCAPPANKPTPEQLSNCRGHLSQELQLLQPRVLFCLGSIAWEAALKAIQSISGETIRPKPKFGHGTEARLADSIMLGCYHVSQQNTFTGRLTPAMIDVVLERAKTLAKDSTPRKGGI